MRKDNDGGQADPPPREELVEQASPKAPMLFGNGGIQINTTDDLGRFADLLLKERMVGRHFRTRGQVIIALQAGAEVGLKPMQALKYIAPINDVPTIWGDGAKSLVFGSGKVETWEDWWEIKGKRQPAGFHPATFADDLVAVTRLGRIGGASLERRFSVGDAKRSRLWTKKGPWSDYPIRMLQIRSMAWAMRDLFPDCLGGLGIREEVMDTPQPAREVEYVTVENLGPKADPVEDEPQPEVAAAELDFE